MSPADAIKRISEKVVVQMLVKASKNRLGNRGEIDLDFEEDFRDPNNLGVVINVVGAAKFKEPAAAVKPVAVRREGQRAGPPLLPGKGPQLLAGGQLAVMDHAVFPAPGERPAVSRRDAVGGKQGQEAGCRGSPASSRLGPKTGGLTRFRETN